MNRILKIHPNPHEKLVDKVYNKKENDSKLSAKLMEDLKKLISTIKNPENQTDETTHNNISGRWNQYSFQYEYYGTFEVSKIGTSYEMKLVCKSEELPLIHPLRILDVTFNGNLWSFYSDWGKKYGIAKFMLYKVNANRYEGYSYLNTHRGRKTIWLRENSDSNDITTDS